jgi:hypothetical protein
MHRAGELGLALVSLGRRFRRGRPVAVTRVIMVCVVVAPLALHHRAVWHLMVSGW